MKLGAIWTAKEAFDTLAKLKKPPKVAYRLMKYARKFKREYDTCEQHRVELVYEAAGAELGVGDVSLKPGTPELFAFIQKFNEFLDQESDLEQVGITLDELVAALDAEQGNVLSEDDLARLEALFLVEKETPVALTVVK